MTTKYTEKQAHASFESFALVNAKLDVKAAKLEQEKRSAFSILAETGESCGSVEIFNQYWNTYSTKIKENAVTYNKDGEPDGRIADKLNCEVSKRKPSKEQLDRGITELRSIPASLSTQISVVRSALSSNVELNKPVKDDEGKETGEVIPLTISETRDAVKAQKEVAKREAVVTGKATPLETAQHNLRETKETLVSLIGDTLTGGIENDINALNEVLVRSLATVTEAREAAQAAMKAGQAVTWGETLAQALSQATETPKAKTAARRKTTAKKAPRRKTSSKSKAAA